MPYRAVMFDLDGTLADTLTDIAAAANHALATLGRPTVETPRFRYLAGQGLEYLIRHALGPGHDDKIAEGMRLFRAYYADHAYDATGPYDGVPALLDALAERGLTLAVLSNKPDPATREMIARLFARWPFARVAGHREGWPLKPDPQSALAIAEELDVPPGEWVYVGDTNVDMRTGKAAGMLTVGVLWGFRDEPELRESGADAIIREPGELLDVIDGRETGALADRTGEGARPGRSPRS